MHKGQQGFTLFGRKFIESKELMEKETVIGKGEEKRCEFTTGRRTERLKVLTIPSPHGLNVFGVFARGGYKREQG